jgi:putative transposase
MTAYNDNITAVQSRRSYHTNVKLLAKMDLLPEETAGLIPKSNISRWKSSDFSGMVDIDSGNKRIEDVKLLMQHEKLLKTCTAVLRVKNTIISVLKKKSERKIKKADAKNIIVRTIDRVKETLSLRKAANCFKITVSKYYNWAKQVKNKCLATLTEKCPRIYPNQLTGHETQKMKDLLEDKKFQGWPIYSIAWYAIKNNILQVSVSSWFKYIKLLGFVKDKPKNPKKNYQPGIIAKKPGEILHADITIFRPLDNTKVYIYIVMDNFSRYILGWKASIQVSSETFVENIKEVYSKYFDASIIREPIELIVDGGPENNNAKVDNFITDIDGAIKKLIAQKDILFSNSVVEAMNKILKYGFLFQQGLPDFESTVRYLEKNIPVYNDVRPHSALDGQTPLEAFKMINLNKEAFKQDFRDAYYRRLKGNKEARCKNCSDEGKFELVMA